MMIFALWFTSYPFLAKRKLGAVYSQKFTKESDRKQNTYWGVGGGGGMRQSIFSPSEDHLKKHCQKF